MKKNEKYHFKRRVVQMETILNLCANREVVHEKHDVPMVALWGKNHKNGCRKTKLLARNEIRCKTFHAHLC
jgi:hypothetical protein